MKKENTLETKIKDLLKMRGPVELSVLWYEIFGRPDVSVVRTAFSMSERGEVWWQGVGEEHAIIGLPEHERPSDPLSFLGLTQITDTDGTYILAPTHLLNSSKLTSNSDAEGAPISDET